MNCCVFVKDPTTFAASERTSDTRDDRDGATDAHPGNDPPEGGNICFLSPTDINKEGAARTQKVSRSTSLET